MTKYCGNCGSPVESYDKFCGNCGAQLQESLLPKPEKSIDSRRSAEQTESRVNGFCVLLIIACIALWLFAPLVSMYAWTIGDPPTGRDLLFEEYYEFEYMKDSPIYWFTLSLAIGCIFCLQAELFKKHIATKVIAFLTEAAIIGNIICISDWFEGDMEYFLDAFGYGFWCIAALLIIIAISSRSPKKTDANSNL